MTIRNQLMLSAALLGWATITPAFAQDNPTAAASATAPAIGESDDFSLPEIVVTAERRSSTEQKTAASITTRSGDDLTRQGRYSLANILENVPGVTGGAAENTGSITGGTDNPAAGLTIRGIQSNVGSGGSITSTAAAAAIYVDGVYNGIGSSYDVERLELLRGPQGTLYGRSATSGVVAIHTRNPKATEFGADLLAQIGSYDLRQLSGAVNIPIIDDILALRVSGNSYEKDGYDSAKGGYRKSTDARVKLLYTPNETFSALVGYAYQDNKANLGGVTIYQPTPGAYTQTISDIGSGENRFNQYWAEFKLDLGGVAVTYLPAYKTWTQNNLGVARGTLPEFNQTIRTPTDTFLTQELRFNSQNDSKLTWQTGLFSYFNKLEDLSQVNLYPSGVQAFRSASRKRTNNIGAFGEATYALTEATRLTGGLRYDFTSVRNNQDYTSITGVTQSLTGDEGLREFENLTYKARVEHDLTPANLLYVSISTGFSPGEVSVTTDVTGDPVAVELDSQTLTAYEIGSKNRFFDERLQVNGAVYYNDYGGFQTAGINVTPDNPTVPTFNTIVAPVKVYGAELEMLARPWRDGQIGLNMAYTHARYDGIPARYQFLFSSNKIPGAIPFQANLWLEHSLDLGSDMTLSGRGELIYHSAFEVSRATVAQNAVGAGPFVRNSAEFLANLSATLGFANGRYALTGYVRNIGDVRYKTGSGITSTATGFVSTVDLSEPRTWGLTATARF